jgi:hypothetical protein
MVDSFQSRSSMTRPTLSRSVPMLAPQLVTPSPVPSTQVNVTAETHFLL